MKIRSLLILVILPCFISAQVTIGSAKKPNGGSLLDLKEMEDENSDVTATRGLLLPRVSLTNLSLLKPMFSYDGTSGTPTDDDLLSHTGLLVFNVNPTEEYTTTCPEGISSGIYIWDGAEWVPMQGNGDYREERLEDASTVIDNRDPANPVTYRIGDFEEAGWWMLDNIRADRMPNGTLINRGIPASHVYDAMYNYPIIATSTILPSDPNNVSTDLVDKYPEYGYLYSWLAATGGKSLEGIDDSNTDTGIQGICPDGWHIPSKKEWLELFKVIEETEDKEICVYATLPLSDDNDTPENKYFAALLSPKIVEGSESVVRQIKGCCVPYEEGGFNFLSLGICSSVGYYGYGNYTRAWTSTRGAKGGENEYNAYMVAFNLSSIRDYQNQNHVTAWYSNAMIPVRCKKN